MEGTVSAGSGYGVGKSYPRYAPVANPICYAIIPGDICSGWSKHWDDWRGANDKELFGVVAGSFGGNSGHADVRFCHHRFNHEQGSPLVHCRLCPLQPISGFYSSLGQISKSQALSELELLLGQKERAQIL